jgi:hypothetical protein
MSIKYVSDEYQMRIKCVSNEYPMSIMRIWCCDAYQALKRFILAQTRINYPKRSFASCSFLARQKQQNFSLAIDCFTLLTRSKEKACKPAMSRSAMMVDCAVQLPRPPPIPVVFDRVQDLLAVAVEKLRRNKLPRVILDRDEPTFLAAKTTGCVTST